MFKFVKNFCGEWIAVPFDSPGMSLLAFALVLLLGAKFFQLAGIGAFLLLILAILIPFLLHGVCIKLPISMCWLCIIHSFFIQRYIDAVSNHAIHGNPEGLGLINIVFLFMILVIACMLLICLASEERTELLGFLTFFVIIITNALYYLSVAISPFPFMDKIILYSSVIQIIIAIISQAVITAAYKKSGGN